MLGCTSRDKQIHLYDPLTNGDGMVLGESTVGGKRSTLIWCDNIGKIVVLGFTRQSTRQYMMFDAKAPEKSIAKSDVDQSAGLMMPHYDPDNNVIYIAGKGDSSIKYFEVTEKQPYVHFLSEFTDSSSQKGIGWAPKYACDTTKCEIARAYRILRDCIQPVAFCVPRKSDMFQEDIFPDTDSWEAAHCEESYFKGENKAAKKVSMDPEQSSEKKEVVFTKKKSYEELEKELAEALEEIKRLKGN